MGYSVIEDQDVQIKMNKLTMEIDKRGFRGLLKPFLEDFIETYNLNISYKAMYQMVSGTPSKVAWKLHYALLLCEHLSLRVEDLFEFIDIDIEEEEVRRKKKNAKCVESKMKRAKREQNG